MTIRCKKLWIMLAEREMSKAELRRQAGLSPATFTKLRSVDYSKFDLGKVYMFILLAILPVMIIYLCLSKFIIKGVTAGSVKG